MSTRRPRVGERRQKNQPLKIDRLPGVVHDAVLHLRNIEGLTWAQIEEQSNRAYSKDWKQDHGGFVDWSSLDMKVLELFPDLRIPQTNLLRWYDLRVAQVRNQALAESERAREFAAAFANANLSDGNSSVINALRDQVFDLIQTAGDGDKGRFIKGLQNLTLAMTRMQRVELQAKRVAVDERRVKALEDDLELKRSNFEKETNAAAVKARKGEGLNEDDINRIRERVFGLGPAPKPAA